MVWILIATVLVRRGVGDPQGRLLKMCGPVFLVLSQQLHRSQTRERLTCWRFNLGRFLRPVDDSVDVRHAELGHLFCIFFGFSHRAALDPVDISVLCADIFIAYVTGEGLVLQFEELLPTQFLSRRRCSRIRLFLRLHRG